MNDFIKQVIEEKFASKAQQHYFNAKATYESVVKNTTLSDIKQTAQQKYDAALAAEKQSSKIAN